MQKTKIHIEKDVIITSDDIDEIMCLALEGGITYWCRDAYPPECLLGDYCSEQISRGGSIVLVDAETGEAFTLTKDKVIDGISLFLNEKDNLWAYTTSDMEQIDVASLDADDADKIVQYALFGELVFG